MGKTLGILWAALVFALTGTALAAEPTGTSLWVYYDAHGKLAYKTTDRGDRIMDFSFAGYMGGGVQIPEVPVKTTLHPSGEDDTAAIQAAIDSLAKSKPAGGIRGTIELSPGEFHCGQTLRIDTSGIVIRGSGTKSGDTIIRMTGSPHVCFTIGGKESVRAIGKAQRIVDSYVPAGTTSVSLDDASALKAGDLIEIIHPVTPAWVEFMGMNNMVRNGKAEHWISGQIRCERSIRSIAANRITLDVPLCDSLDERFLKPAGASIEKVAVSGRISQVGIEQLRIVATAKAVGLDVPQHHAMTLSDVEDSWIRNVDVVDTIGSVEIHNGCRRITARDVNVSHSVSVTSSAKPADFFADGTQLLFHHCSSTGNNLFYLVTGGGVTGPNVMLDCTFNGNGHIQPHMRWATGLLVDNCNVPHGGIDFMNRGEMGSGHGWTMGWGVAWNCTAEAFVIQTPPGCTNWAIGCIGKRQLEAMPFGKSPMLPEGTFDSHGMPVMPESLYRAQLRERLGEGALRALD